MIWIVIRTGFTQLRRDRGALLMSFVLPVCFFSIFALIFGRDGGNTTPRINLIVVDEDHSAISQRLVAGLQQEVSLNTSIRPSPEKNKPVPPEYDAEGAERAVHGGEATAALIIPKGFGANLVMFEPGKRRNQLLLLHDRSDPIAPPMVTGLLQKAALTSLRDIMMQSGIQYMEKSAGGLTPAQEENIGRSLTELHQLEMHPELASRAGSGNLIDVEVRDVVGEKKRSPMISFYAAAIGAMFLLFTSSAAGGTLIDESETGTLDRILSARVSMTELMLGKLLYCTLLAALQLTVMFLWAAAVFHVELFSHLPGFFTMTVMTSFAAASFGILLASLSRSRAVQSSVATLIILTMSAIGGSMFPRFLMPSGMQKAGLITYNAWAIDGFTKVFWRDEPVSHLLPQIAFLALWGIVLFVVARRIGRKWEHA